MSLNEIEIHCLKDKKQTETLILDNVKTLKLVFFSRAASQDHLGAYNAHQNKPPGRITCLIVSNKCFESNENNWVDYFFFFRPLEYPGQKHWRLVNWILANIRFKKQIMQQNNWANDRTFICIFRGILALQIICKNQTGPLGY